MKTTVTITLTTSTNTILQAKDNMSKMLQDIANDATKYGVITVESGSPNGHYSITVKET